MNRFIDLCSNLNNKEISELIKRRRRQILVHSYIYYDLNDNIVSDNIWNLWAKQLCELQREYPLLSEKVEFHYWFKDFDGSTGYNLPYRDPSIVKIAENLIKHNKRAD